MWAESLRWLRFGKIKKTGKKFKSFPLLSSSSYSTSMLVLYETAAGYALFKLVNDSKLEKSEDIWKDFETSEKANAAYVP
jgi:hypothetical protein